MLRGRGILCCGGVAATLCAASPSSAQPAASPPTAAPEPESPAPAAASAEAAPTPTAPPHGAEAAPPAAESPAPTATAAPELDRELERALAADRAATAPEPAEATPSPAPPAGCASMNPDLSLILDVAGAAFHGGKLQTGEHDPAMTGMNLQQLELAAGANVDPYFRFDGHVVFHTEGVDLEEAYGTTLGLPLGLQARFGQFLHRFGRINSTHPHTWDFVDQPFALGRVFGSEGGRGVGTELSWLTPLPWYVEVVGTVQLATGGTTARSFYGETSPAVHGLKDFLYVTAVKQFFPLSDDWSLNWGLSGAFGPSHGAFTRSDVYGTDVYLKYRPITRESPTIVSLTSEWLYRRRIGDGDTLSDVTSYTQLFYRFAARWAAAARYEFGSVAFTGAGTGVVDPLDPDWLGARHRIAANVSFWPTEFSRLRLQGSRNLEQDAASGWAAFLAVELVAGAHGAHAF